MDRLRIRIKSIASHPLFSGSLIMVGGNMIANVVNYLYHLVMGRILGPVEYGILASLYSILYLTGIIPTSASVSIVKFISSAKDTDTTSVYSAINKFILKLSVVLCFLLIVISPLIQNFLKIGSIWPVVLLSPIVFLTLLTLVNQSASQGLLKFEGSAIPSIIVSLLKLVLGIAFVFLGWSVFGSIFGIMIGYIVAYFYSVSFIKKILKKGRVSNYNLTAFYKFSLPVLLQALAFTSLFTTDLLLVKHFFEPFQAGIYAALSTLGKIIFFATSPIIATMFPIVAKRHAEGVEHKKIFWITLAAIFATSIAVTLTYWLLPDLAIGVLYGKAYLSAAHELVWMGIFMLFYSLANLLVNYGLSTGNSRIVIFPLLGAIAQIPLIWLWHGSLLTVIQISLAISVIIFLSTGMYLKYNR